MSASGTNGGPPRDTRRCFELIEVMRQQELICRRLLDHSGRERVAVLENRLDELELSTREKSELIEQMDRLEQRRRTLAEQLAGELALPPDTSLVGLATRIAGEEGDDLLELRRRVADVVTRLRDSNDGNLMLMRKSLDLVRDSIRQFRRSTGPGEVYTSDGRSAVSVKNNIVVDCHA